MSKDEDLQKWKSKKENKKQKKEKKVLSKTELDNMAMEINKQIDENEEKIDDLNNDLSILINKNKHSA